MVSWLYAEKSDFCNRLQKRCIELKRKIRVKLRNGIEVEAGHLKDITKIIPNEIFVTAKSNNMKIGLHPILSRLKKSRS